MWRKILGFSKLRQCQIWEWVKKDKFCGVFHLVPPKSHVYFSVIRLLFNHLKFCVASKLTAPAIVISFPKNSRSLLFLSRFFFFWYFEHYNSSFFGSHSLNSWQIILLTMSLFSLLIPELFFTLSFSLTRGWRPERRARARQGLKTKTKKEEDTGTLSTLRIFAV